MIITPATIDNLIELTNVARRAYCDHYLHLWFDSGNWYLDHYLSLENFKQELENSDFKFYLIYDDLHLVGFLKLNMKPLLGYSPEECMEVERIYIVKEAVNKGIGSAVMKSVETIGKEQKKSGLFLKVMDSSTDAISFYKKMGYSIQGTYQLTFPQLKAELRGMYIMEKHLS